jgi:Sphingosine kinase and enzymes related to eukaryotic diacylglycerol kinase
MHVRSRTQIPAFVNPLAGNAPLARAVLRDSGRFEIEDVTPDALANRVRSVVKEGATRVLVAGGDGSLGAAVEGLLGTRAELAILPCGTLNHLAKDLSLPLELHDAARVAIEGRSIPLDAASVNGRVFLNTSSVGAYVTFVRARERLEHRIGYHTASMIAAARLFVRLPVFRVSLQLSGGWHQYVTPLVFVGVNERELRVPLFGARLPHGRTGLHVMVVRRRSGARALALALSAVARGVHAVSRTPAMDTFLVDSLRIESTTRHAAIDGEIVKVQPPLEYRHVPNSLRVVVPEDQKIV